MKRTPTASLAFAEGHVETKPGFGSNVIEKLTGNANFPNPPYTMAELTTVNTALSEAIAKAHSGDHNAIATRIEAEKKWDIFFRATAKYVGTASNGSEVLITSAGFTPTKDETQPAQLPVAPAEFNFNPVKGSGKALATSKGAPGAKGYLTIAKTKGVTMSMQNDCIMFSVGSEKIYLYPETNPKKMLEGLQSKVSIEACMLAFNATGVGEATSLQEVTPQ